MTLNVLFISIAFPPKNDPEAVQAGRYFKWLSKDQRLNIDVVTSSNPTLFMPIDSSLEHYGEGVRQLLELPILESIYTNKIIRLFNPSLLSYPDSKFSFSYQSSRVIKSLRHKPDIIYSRSFPLSSSFLAQKLAEYYKVPWVMHLSDPWVESPLHIFKGKNFVWNKKKEQEFFSKADAITLTSPKTVELYRSKYPQYCEKIHLMPNVFDSNSSLREIQKATDRKPVYKFVYTGGLANTRDASTLLKAVHQLDSSHPKLLQQAEFTFAGPMDRRNFKILDDLAHPRVKHLGSLPASEAKKLQEQADVLLLFDSQIEDPMYDVFFPSKLLDYLVAQKPVLAITGSDSFSRSFINQLNIGTAFNFNEIAAVAAQIKTLIEQQPVWQPIHAEIDFYSAQHNAQRLAALMLKLTHKLCPVK